MGLGDTYIINDQRNSSISRTARGMPNIIIHTVLLVIKTTVRVHRSERSYQVKSQVS